MKLRAIPYQFPQTSRAQTPNAPVFDPSKKTKSWVDPNPPSDPVTYTILNPDYTFGTITISKAEAMTPNLPGHPDYPAYNPAPSHATFNGTVFPVSSKQDAEALAKELGVDPGSIFDEMGPLTGSFPLVYPPDDARRAWGITVGGVSVQVATLLARKNANGVGAPGHWNGINWVSDLPSADASSPVMPVPLGLVAPGASIVFTGPAGMGPMLQEPDPNATVAPTGNGDGFTDADRAMLTALYNCFKKVYGALIS